MQFKGAEETASVRATGKASQRRGHLILTLNLRFRLHLNNRSFIARDGSLTEGGKFEQRPSKGREW